MRTIHILILCLFICLFPGYPLNAQTCGPEVVVDPDGYEGFTFFNYGSTANSKSNTYKTAFAVGQTFVGYMDNIEKSSTLGFYARYFLPPFGMKVNATQGELLDRILVSWEIDALGPAPSEGFQILRDGELLATVPASARSYPDFNVIPGIPYTYCVRGVNVFGQGVESCTIGFQVPNGTVTGWISSLNGSPVPDASVTLTPMQGFSALFNDGDGALAIEDPLNPFLPLLDRDWTITFWIKTDTAGATPGKLIGMPGLYIRSRPNTGGQNGIAIATTAGGTALLAINFPDNPDAWHHVALTYDGNGNKARLYFDGKLVGLSVITPVPSPDTLKFGELAGPGLWVGRLDEVRIYHHQLDELDFDMVMDGTASSTTPHLSHYWKMDEELGMRSYDIVKRHPLYFCGPEGKDWFDQDRPPVHTAAITNEDGYYKIESASYGTGTTFLATPKKNFYLHRSLKFEKAETDSVLLPDFPITKKATIEMWVNSAGVDNFQCLLAKQWGAGNEFRIILAPNGGGTDNQIRAVWNEQVRTFGDLGSDFQHLAFTWDSTSRIMKLYKNGIQLGTDQTWSSTIVNTGNWSDPAKPWFVGIRPDGTSAYGGLIDEIAFYDTTLSVQTIQHHRDSSRNIQEDGLRVYFPFDEGSGTKVNNVGSVLVVGGTTYGTQWSALAQHQVIEPHIFSPSTRQVTLNPSVTSVDQVDFIDRSTVPVTGYVRYANTDCFANNIEILVNGQSFSPPIFTDTTGKFIIDFDPGMTATLKPKFEDHTFTPAFWQVTNVSSPIAGIVFNDMKTRTLVVRAKGGECGRSLVAGNQICVVKVRSVDNCLSRTDTLTAGQTQLVFTNLPPKEVLTVAIVEHSLPDIYDAFQAQGGFTVDLSTKNDTVNFKYIAPPVVEITSGLVTQCNPPVTVWDQGEMVTLQLTLKEIYPGGNCFVDTASFHIINDAADEVVDTTMGNGLFVYEFEVGNPNPSPPHTKTIQFISTTLSGVESSRSIDVIVTGIKTNLNTFTSMMPEIPTLILRDPPGDGSSSFLQKGEKICNTTEIVSELETGGGGSLAVEYSPSINWVVAPLGVGNILILDPEIGNEFEGQVTFKQLTANSFETCMSFDEKISTSSGDLLVGGANGADLYMGNAFNIIFGLVDEITFSNCEVSVEQSVQVQSGGIATTFVYSEFNIRYNIIRYLGDLAEAESTNDADSILYMESIDRWEAILLRNDTLKQEAEFIRNISFDAGINYDYSETSSVSGGSSQGSSINSEISNTIKFGIHFEDAGITGAIKLITNTSNSTNESTGEEKGITTGYSLSDDDPLDQFTVDVKMDTVYKTPVFKTLSGQSSCPWEENTANREWPNLFIQPGFETVVTNVPANEPAVYQLILGNESGSHEDWTYGLTAIASSNPFGAIIKLDGASLIGAMQRFIVPYGQTDTVTITVEKGPIEYTYDNLIVALVSECEYQRDLALALFDHEEKFFSSVSLGAHFIKPCSEVNITVPQQEEWVIKSLNASLPITATGYDLTEPDFKYIQLQWRPTGGDGAWINITGANGKKFNKYASGYNGMGSDTLGPVFTSFSWNTGTIADGPYEIRAVAHCENLVTGDGFSKIIKGYIDRLAPVIIGVPEPADGVYNLGDEISFTFDQPIDCNKINPVTHLHLFKSSGNVPIPFTYSCDDNKIIINPGPNTDIENILIKAKLDTIKDFVGNKFVGTTLNKGVWEFYVDRSELAWMTDSMGMTKYDDEPGSAKVKIHNRAGYPVDFAIQSIPNYLHVTPTAGSLVPNEIREIEFATGDTLNPGWLSESVVLHPSSNSAFFMGGDEVLPIGVRTLCRPPAWEIDPGDFQFSMTLITRLTFNGVISTDPEDMVAAFIDGELRGVAKLTYAPTSTNWIAFLTIYGNNADINKLVTYEIFDASACLRHPGFFTSNPFNFTPDGSQGTPTNTRMLSTNGTVVNDIPLNTGWNWISFNVHFPDSTIKSALEQISIPAGDLIKDQFNFSVNTNNTWAGSLDTLGNTSMYMYQAKQPNNIRMTGTPLPPASVPLTITNGWNWISYIPTYKLTVNQALASLAATAGDVIKSQTSFATYVNSTVGWVGNLQKLEPPKGYLLKMTTGGTLIYPPQNSIGEGPIYIRNGESLPPFWNLDASQYEHNMTLIGIFEFSEVNATTADMELGAFVGDELRGSGKAVYIDFLDSYMFFLTCFANTNGEQLHFKLYDASTAEIQMLEEKITFVPNHHMGSIDDPVPFNLQTTGIGEMHSELSFNVQPNPFRDETVCRIELPEAQRVHLIMTDMEGRNVFYTPVQANAGINSFVWKGCSGTGTPLPNGVYFIRLETGQGVLTKKVMLQR